jgi:dipeptidase E
MNLKGLFAGSGVEGLSNPLINAQILDLLPAEKKKAMETVRVLYLGTATYDIAYFREKQTGRFVDKGCSVSSLDVAAGDIDLDAASKAIREADVLLVGGGNTLFAVDRWNHLGLVPHLQQAMERGCILTGGSAGAICWFDSGHSDSADPDTYQTPMLRKYARDDENGDKPKDESSDYDPSNKKEWKYLRVPGLGFVPGPLVCCPHHDKVQSNGLLRAHDFDQMLLERARSSSKSVLGIGIDHYSAFVVEGDSYKIYALPDKPGSVSEKNTFDVDDDGTPHGVPGVWLKRVLVAETISDDLAVEAMVCPPEGKLVDLLAYGGDNLPSQHNEEPGANQIAVDKCRSENPSGIEL